MTFDMSSALLKRYAPPEYALFFEVGNGTGMNCDRHADAVAMSLWPSRGLEIIGIECKASRADWLREKKNPQKAESISSYCDRFYLAISEAEIVLDGELPVTWGLLAPRGGKLTCIREAERLSPKPLDRNFVAALLRRASEDQGNYVHKKDIRKELDAKYDEGRHSAETEIENYKRLMNRAVEKLFEAEKAFGVPFGFYGYDNIKAIAQILRQFDDPQSYLKSLRGRISQLESEAHRVLSVCDQIRAGDEEENKTLFKKETQEVTM